jgi:hypothetical protein
MARTYAGIVGLLAFATVVARNLAHDNPGGETIWYASVMLFGFAAIGYFVGLAAQWITDESVRERLNRDLQKASGASVTTSATAANH